MFSHLTTSEFTTFKRINIIYYLMQTTQINIVYYLMETTEINTVYYLIQIKKIIRDINY